MNASLQSIQALIEADKKIGPFELEGLRDFEQVRALEVIKAVRVALPAISDLLARLRAAEDIVDRVEAKFPEKKLRAIVHGYRLQFPKDIPGPSAPETTGEGK